ncbi:MAG: lysozyme inhibitor LprI family protein [Paracoccaceae bacterium]
MKVTAKLFSAALLILPTILSAQTAVLDRSQVHACFASTPNGSVDPDCIGAASNTCQAVTPGGGTTIGAATCVQAETQAWDEILNREYKATRSLFADEPGLADQLLAAQRAWLAFRDAECAFVYAMWMDGTMRTIAASNCVLDLTARRSLELRDMR